jgi:hypothetical protein
MKHHPYALRGLICLGLMLYTASALAQVDLSGNWVVESDQGKMNGGAGPFPDDFAGMPISKDGRQAALSFSGDERQELNRECEPWSATYLLTGPWGGRIWPTWNHNGQVVSWSINPPVYDRLTTVIWMDGRTAPPTLGLHSYEGFSTGKWEGPTLVVTTTQLKDSYIDRNGVPASNRNTFRLFLTRHGDRLTVLGVIRDPIYLTGPWVLAKTWKLVEPVGAVNIPLAYCPPSEVQPGFSDGYHTAEELPAQVEKQKTYMLQHYNIPLEAAMGGTETMYPEYRKKLKGVYKTPTAYCSQYCCYGGRGDKQICRNAN